MTPERVTSSVVQTRWRWLIAVCANQRDPAHQVSRPCCGRDAGQDVVRRLKDLADTQGLRKELIITRTGCLDVCSGRGTSVWCSARPEEVAVLQPDDVEAWWNHLQQDLVRVGPSTRR